MLCSRCIYGCCVVPRKGITLRSFPSGKAQQRTCFTRDDVTTVAHVAAPAGTGRQGDLDVASKGEESHINPPLPRVPDWLRADALPIIAWHVHGPILARQAIDKGLEELRFRVRACHQ